MRLAILCFAAGAFWLQQQRALPSPAISAGLACAGLLLLLYARYARWRAARACLGAALLGFAWAAVMAGWRLAPSLPPELEGRDVVVTGVVASLPAVVARGQRFQLDVARAQDGAGAAVTVPPRVALSWYAAPGSEGPALRPGERWQLTVRLQRPHGLANPHGFDYEALLLEQGVRATGYVRPSDGNVRLQSFVAGAGYTIERMRDILRRRLLAALADAPYAGVIVALVIGDQRGIGWDDWDVFQRTGIAHLVSISGLHVTMLAGLVAGLVGFFWRRSFFTGARLPLYLPAQKAAALAGLAAALLYVLLAGFGVPAQRTLIMLAVVAVALWQGRLVHGSAVLCLALGVVVFLDPWAVRAPGFWLSFGAVAVILFAAGSARMALADEGWRPRLTRRLGEAARLQYAITLGLVPLTLLLFGQVSLVSPLANALAIPLVSFLVTPLALLGAVLPVPLDAPVLAAAHALLAGLAAVLETLSAQPWAIWQLPMPPLWAFAAACAGTAWLLAPRGWPCRWLGLPALLPMLLQAPTHPAPGALWVTVFDVGQGTAVLVETARHRLLYDTGPAYSPEADGAARVILPYLRGRGIGWLDGVVISHNDADHSGGARSLFAQMPVGWASSSLDPGSPLLQGAPAHRPCQAGQEWEWDGVRFEMLHPAPADYARTRLPPNARSCTLRISNGRHALLLPGDIEAPQEAELLSRGSELAADILLAPHHGSGTSSTPSFLAAVAPRLALFQVGHRNRYRHPQARVWARYEALGIERLRTDRDGALLLEIGDDVKVRRWREEARRYWQAP